MSNDCGRPDLTFKWCARHREPLAACTFLGRRNCKDELRFVGPSIFQTSPIPNQNTLELGIIDERP